MNSSVTLYVLIAPAAQTAADADPQPGQVIGPLIFCLTFVASAFAMLVLVCTAAVLRPPQLLAETSVLGRQVVGLARFLLAFIGFLGGLLLTTMIAAGDDHWASASGLASLTNQLWMTFLSLAAAVAYFYWLWIAIDLIRLGRARRLSAVDWWYKHWLSRFGAPWAERALRAVSRAIVGGPWWVILVTFYMAPLTTIVSAMQLIRMAVPPASL